MLSEIRSALRPALSLLILFTLVLGLAYPLLATGISQVVMPGPANGSMIVHDGKVIGSELIAQGFARPGYFHPRPSAAGANGYDASASSGSNLAPGSKDLRDRLVKSIAEVRATDMTSQVPPDLVTTSASGLDPEVSPEAAFVQVRRVAAARGMAPAAVEALVRNQVKQPLLGFLGEPRVNVLNLNLALDAAAVQPTPAQSTAPPSGG
jgi:K+-transporting ATPase ATPase C chain